MATFSQTRNSELMYQARQALLGKWGLAVGTCFVYCLVTIVVQIIPGLAVLMWIFFIPPMYIGCYVFNLAISRNQPASTSQIFDGFNNYWYAIGLYLLMMIFIILWSLLLVIPGIIAAFSYAMAPYILVDNPTITPLNAIRKSIQMMRGYKWKLFGLQLRFLGWILLGILTLGIGYLWITPYIEVSYAKFYDDLLKHTNIFQKTKEYDSSRF